MHPILEKLGFARLFTHLPETTELQLDIQIHPFIALGPGHSPKESRAGSSLEAMLEKRCRGLRWLSGFPRAADTSAEFSGTSTTLRALGHMVSLGWIKEAQPSP